MKNRNHPVDKIEENLKDNDNNQLSNLSEVLKSSREAKRVMKNNEAIKRAQVNATKSEERNEDSSIDKTVIAAPMDHSKQGYTKAMCGNNSGVGSSKRPKSN